MRRPVAEFGDRESRSSGGRAAPRGSCRAPRAEHWIGFAVLALSWAPACSGDGGAPSSAGAGGVDAASGGEHDAASGGAEASTSSGGSRADAAHESGSSGTPGAGGGGAGGAGGNTGGTASGGGPDAGASSAGPEDGGALDGQSDAPSDAPDAEGAPCAPPRTSCSGACTDLSSDPNNCGRCTRACAALEACVNGSCTSAHCGRVSRFTIEAEQALGGSGTNGGASDSGATRDGSLPGDGGARFEAGGAEAGLVVVPNRVVLARSPSGSTLDAWVAASNGVYRLPGTVGASLLSSPLAVLTGASQALSLAKLDGDAMLDIVNDTFAAVDFVLSAGDSGLSVAGSIPVGEHEGSVLPVDIDGDQEDEIVVAALHTADNLADLSIYKVPPFGSPSLWRHHNVPLGGSLDVYGLAAGNFDHDGYKDIALAAYGASGASLDSGPALVTFANTPSGLADPLVHRLPAGRVRTPLVFDFDRDGFDDVVAVSGQSAYFFAGSSTGLPVDPAATALETSFSYSDAAAADFDRDGKLDLALVRRIPPTSTEVVPAWGDGHGAFVDDFTQAIDLSGVSGLAAGDVDGDGRADLVAISADRGSVTAVRNGCN